jgi:KipI family sensor histidine kinase inhibitor
MTGSVVPLSDRAVSMEVDGPDAARRLAAALRTQGVWQEVVPGLASVAAFFDPAAISFRQAKELVLEAARLPTPQDTVRRETIEIEVRYGGKDGPDLPLLCERTGLSEDGVIALHTGSVYTVAIMGFLPGFAYLSGLSPKLATPRLANPRTRVPAGSVGIGGEYAGVYSLEGSGGWTIIGKTDRQLFDLSAANPFLLSPGTSLTFKAVR